MSIPSSRSEAIIQAKINGEEYKGLPQSRLEADLLQLDTGGGGGGGTKDYNKLINRPTINGSVASGEISGDILDLIEPLTSAEEEEILGLISEDDE